MKNLYIIITFHYVKSLIEEFIMEIKYNLGEDCPGMIKDLVDELSKDEFVSFRLASQNETYNFFKVEDSIVEFKEDYLKKINEDGDVLYLDYYEFFKIIIFNNEEKTEKKEKKEVKKENPFNDDDDWTGNRIQF